MYLSYLPLEQVLVSCQRVGSLKEIVTVIDDGIVVTWFVILVVVIVVYLQRGNLLNVGKGIVVNLHKVGSQLTKQIGTYGDGL